MTSQRTLKIKFDILRGFVLFITVLGLLTVFAASAIAQNPVPFIDPARSRRRCARRAWVYPDGERRGICHSLSSELERLSASHDFYKQRPTDRDSACIRHCHGVLGRSHSSQPQARRRFRRSVL